MASSAWHDTPLSRIGVSNMGVLESGVYMPGIHEPWMCILTLSRVSARDQTFLEVTAPQFLRCIDDPALREQVERQGQGHIHEMVVTLYKLDGQSQGLQIIMELNAADLDYKDPK